MSSEKREINGIRQKKNRSSDAFPIKREDKKPKRKIRKKAKDSRQKGIRKLPICLLQRNQNQKSQIQRKKRGLRKPKPLNMRKKMFRLKTLKGR